MKRNTLLAGVAAIGLLVATPNPSHAIFGVGDVVLDPANLAQNVLQVVEAVENGLRVLRQIELATQTVTGTDFSISPELNAQLRGVQGVLNNGASLVFEQTESLEQFRDIFPEGFEALDTLENVVDVFRGQNQRILNASQQAVQTQSLSAETIEDIIGNVQGALLESEAAVGQTAAIQAGNQLQGQIVAMLGQIQGASLADQRLRALEAAERKSQQRGLVEARDRFHNAEDVDLEGQGYVPQGWPTQ